MELDTTERKITYTALINYLHDTCERLENTPENTKEHKNLTTLRDKLMIIINKI